MRLLAAVVAFAVAITALGQLYQEAEAKGPAYSSEYTFEFAVQRLLLPMIVAAGLGIMIAYYAKESQVLKER